MTEDQQRRLEDARPASSAQPLWGDLAEPEPPAEFTTSRPAEWTANAPIDHAPPPPFPKEVAEATERIRLIEESLACFRFGCLALVPAAGMFPAFLTLRRFTAVQHRGGSIWNPARRHLFGGLWLAVIGCATSTVLLAWLIRLLKGGNGALLFLVLAVSVLMGVVMLMTLCSAKGRREFFNHPLVWFLGALIAIVLAEWTLFAYSTMPEPWAWPAVGVSLPFAMWAASSVLWRDANESFRDFPGALLGWLLLATVFAVQGLLALVDHRPLAMVMALLLPVSLAVRLAGAVVRDAVRQSCLWSIAMHATWAVISIPFLGAAAHLAGLWDGGVLGVDIGRMLRLDW
jgi:hypothetical protein